MNSNKIENSDQNTTPQEGRDKICEWKNSNFLGDQSPGVTENFKKGVNMGSNSDTVNPKNEPVGESLQSQENNINDQQIPPILAEKVATAVEEIKKFGENEGKNVPTQIISQAPQEVPAIPANQNKQEEAPQSVPEAAVQPEPKVATTSENFPKPRVMEENTAKIPEPVPEQQTHHFTPTADAPMEPENLEKKEAEKSEISKEGGSPHKPVGSTDPQQPGVKRALRERRTRGTRGSDSSNKCHVCDKNGLRATLIPCTKGKEN